MKLNEQSKTRVLYTLCHVYATRVRLSHITYDAFWPYPWPFNLHP